MSSSVDVPAHSGPCSHRSTPRRNRKPGGRRWIKAVAIGAAAVALVTSAIVGTVAAQTLQLFEDVPRGHYAHDAIEWAVENEITRGCGAGFNFCPDGTLTRAEIVTFLKRYHDQFHGTTADDSDDSDDSDDPEEWVVDGFGTTGRLSADSVTLAAGQYVATFELRFRHADADAIKEIEVLVGGPETISNRPLFPKLVAADVTESGGWLTFRQRGSFEVSSRAGLTRLPEGRIYFTVTVTPRDSNPPSIASAQWEIVVTER